MNQNEQNDQNDHILETLRPRMQAARVAHLRRVFAGMAVIPLLGFGAVAMAAGADDGVETETATSIIDDTESDTKLPELGDGDGSETNPGPDKHETDEHDTASGEEPSDGSVDTTTTAPDPDAPQQIELGALGTLEIAPEGEAFAVLAYGFTDGWEVLSSESDDGVLRIIIGNGEVMKVIIVEPGVRDEISVVVDDFVIPTTTTTAKPEPEPEPKPEPEPEPEPIVDRFTVDVAGKGSFIVERDGNVLSVGNVTAAEGYDYEIHDAQGSKVSVGFYGADHVYFGKALINEAGDVEQYVWDEPLGPEPVYQWVEISGIGAAKFEVHDGVIRLIETETAAGFESWDYNQGAAAATIKVDFEGEGQIWFIDAWLDEQGALAWSTYQG